MGFHCEEARSTILFDLDGTLLPMDMKEFERAYFGGLCRAIPEMAPGADEGCLERGKGHGPK